MEDDRSIYAILGIESQTDVDYSMVARVLIYDTEHGVHYRMNLIEPFRLSDEDLIKFQTDMRLIMAILKATDNKKACQKILAETMHSPLSPSANRLLRTLSGYKQLQSKSKEEQPMWKGIEDLCADAKAEGLATGRAQMLLAYLKQHDCELDAAFDLFDIEEDDRPGIIQFLEANK